MASEQVRLATIAIGPLLRKRGTSPALGVSLRRAVRALDKALVEDDLEISAEAARQTIAELKQCLPLIHESSRPADHEQLEGITNVLALLAPLELTMPPAPLPAPTQSAPSACEPFPPLPFHLIPPTPPAPPPQPVARITATPAAQPFVPPTLNFPTVRVRLVGLKERLRVLRVAVDSPFSTLREVDAAHAGLQKIVRSINWLGQKRLAAFRQEGAETENPERQLVANLALIHLGDPDAVESLVAGLEKQVAGKRGLSALTNTILRTLVDADALERLLKVFLSPSEVAIFSLLLPILAEHGLLSSSQLLDFANHPNDDVAVSAAEALARSGDSRDAPILLSSALGAPTPARANALLFAAVALGSVAALTEVRQRLSEHTVGASFHLVEALAIAGDDSDADGLLALATSPEVDASQVLLVAANLGCMGVVEALPGLADRVPQGVLEEARRMVTGGRHHTTDRPVAGMRLLRGKPWSVSGLLSRLGAADEPIQSQQRLALEIRVRTGIVPPTRFPLLMSKADRSALLANWSRHFARANDRLRPGGWYYQGKPIKPANGEGEVR